MQSPARFLRLAIVVLPFLIAAGCIRGTSVGYEGQPPPGVPGAVAVAPAGNDAVPAGDDAFLEGDREVGASAPEAVSAVGTDAAVDAAAPAPRERPGWLGTIPLPPAPDDGSALPTPPELVDRQLPPPPGGLPAPADETFAASVGTIPDDVLARSTWKPDCPVGLEDLRYLTVTHWGFDEQVHTGELIVHATAAEALVGVFERLHELRFPIEEMRVISDDDMTALSTGDGNVSSAFVCRKKVSGRSWSEHSYGLALDLNPFHNPYLAGTLVVPGLAGTYLDREDVRPGMIVAGDDVVQAFAGAGWRWGGDWSSAKDWMHFSANGR